MVFARLTQDDKIAFFALLDEYFEQRPNLLNQTNGVNHTGSETASITSRRVSTTNTTSTTAPATTQAPKRPPAPAVKAKTFVPVQESTPANNDEEEEQPVLSVRERMAGMRAALESSNSVQAPSRPTPPPVPRTSSSSVKTPYRPTAVGSSPGNPGAPAGLVSTKSVGNIDTTSKMSIATSLIKNKTKGDAKENVHTPPLPSAFPKRENSFAPPPKRTTSGTATPKSTPGAEEDEPQPPPAPRPGARRPIPPPEPEPEPEPEEVGEWAEVLYDFEAQEDDELSINVGDQVLITDRTDKSWWRAQLNGREGLIPASYSKIL